MRFTELLAMYKRKRYGELAFSSAKNVEPMYRRWRGAFGALEVTEITPAHVEGYRLLRDDGSRGGSVLNSELSELNGLFAFACALGEIQESPVKTWRRRRVQTQKEYVVLDHEEENLLGHFIGDLTTWRYVQLAIATGLRQGTIRAIEEEWLDRIKGILRIPAARMKTRKALTLPLSEKAFTAVTSLLDSRDGGPLIPSQQKIHRLVKEAAAQAGLPAALSPHDFRRTWVARMRDAGADMSDVLRLGGWESPTVMLRHYFGEVPETRARELLEKV